MKKIIVSIISSILITYHFSVAASFFENEKVSAMKCGKAAFYLGDDYLERATNYYVKTQMKGVDATPKEVMEMGQEIREEAEPDGRQTQKTIDIANEWKESEFCESVLATYSEYLNSEAQRLINTKIESATSPVSCSIFIDQYAASKNKFYAEDDRNAIFNKIKENATYVASSLKDHQKNAFLSLLEKNPTYTFNDLHTYCYNKQLIDGSATLQQAMLDLDFVKEAKSKVTVDIENYVKSINESGSCGDMEKYFCEKTIQLRAASEALDMSKRCDLYNENCHDSMHEFFDPIYKKLKMENLVEVKKQLESDSRVGDRSIYDAVFDKCYGELIASNIPAGDEFAKYQETICRPRAETESKKPSLDALEKVNQQLSILPGVENTQ